MVSEEVFTELVNIQTKVDAANTETLKEEHKLKLAHFNNLKQILSERDKITKDIEGFWETVLVESEFIEVLGEMDYKEDQSELPIDVSWVSEVIVEYREDYKYYVGIKAKENPFFENTFLEKEFSLFENPNCVSTQMQWKNKKLLDNPLIRFFTSTDTTDDDANISIFQLLCDIYFNAVYYYVRLDENHSDCSTH
ncbi:template-activating factor I [Nematocida parisii]|uniref:Template-activating factor I n=1 Tax=Nematocida parisii (strain ERTm3) TaxID=935791 RepID=I3EDQ6_NEMP3|nr:hypothetical protein NEQG_02476 [Nematocida parisii ERTm3]KAI5127587.1 template-activating factor I [Nematocida parisii]KAI5127862.1 template-activating factor I [Nematocida parisii]KAI5141622.1 template-activating factor I [Nematocida parisii]KAI5145627.1 template-activating factor I [Nematocida parisii]